MRRLGLILISSCLLVACGSSSKGANDAGPGDPAFDDAGIDVAFGDASPDAPDAGQSVGCIAGDVECNNCIDDDDDGLIDGFDPECTGIIDRSEASFATGIPGDNRSSNGVQDCFFDGNSGGGNDGCFILDCCFETPRTCTLAEEERTGTNKNNAGCVGSEACINNCGDLAPPGCDCFGCCTVCDPANPSDCQDIYLPTDIEDPCTSDNLDACTTCTKNDSCGNDCDNAECELCPGQTPDDLPESCNGQECPNGETVCTGQAQCLDTEYCSNGCCITSIIIVE